MYLVKNAVLNLLRNKNIYIWFALIFVLLNAVVIIVLVQYGYSAASIEYIDKEYGRAFRVSRKDGNIMAEDEYAIFASLPLVEEVLYNNYLHLIPSDSLLINEKKAESGDLLISGVGDRITDRYTLNEGKWMQGDAECVINETFAAASELKTGDHITVSDTSSGKEVSLKITGITGDDVIEELYKSVGLADNHITTYIETAKTFYSENQKVNVSDYKLGFDTVFYITSYELSTDFIYAVVGYGADIDTEGLYTAKRDKNGYAIIAEPLEKIHAATGAMTLIIMTAMFAVTFFLILAQLNERRYEIGVLKSLGMSRRQITVGYSFELLAFILAAIIAGTVIGLPLAVWLTRLTGQIELNNSLIWNNSIKAVAATVTGEFIISMIFSRMIGSYISHFRPMLILIKR